MMTGGGIAKKRIDLTTKQPRMFRIASPMMSQSPLDGLSLGESQLEEHEWSPASATI